MSNRAYEKALEDYNDEHRFDDREVVEYWVGDIKFRNVNSANDYCHSNGYETSNIREKTYKVNWRGGKI